MGGNCRTFLKVTVEVTVEVTVRSLAREWKWGNCRTVTWIFRKGVLEGFRGVWREVGDSSTVEVVRGLEPLV